MFGAWYLQQINEWWFDYLHNQAPASSAAVLFPKHHIPKLKLSLHGSYADEANCVFRINSKHNIVSETKQIQYILVIFRSNIWQDCTNWMKRLEHNSKKAAYAHSNNHVVMSKAQS